jgi:hypothetical protein
MSFSINISVKAVDEASATLRNVDSAAKNLLDRVRELYAATERGTKLTDSAAKEIRRLASDVRAQENAQRLLSRAWLASHDSLLLVMDGFRRAASLGRNVLDVVNSLMLASTAHATATKNLRDAQIDLAKAEEDVNYWQNEVNRALEEGGEGSDRYNAALRELDRATRELEEAKRRLRDAQDELNNVQAQGQIQLLGLGLRMLDIIPSATLLASTLTALKTAGTLAALGTGLLVTAVAALGAGLAYGLVNVFQHKTALNTWEDAVRAAYAETQKLPSGLREVAYGFTVAGAGLILIGDKLGVFFGTTLPKMFSEGFEWIRSRFAELGGKMREVADGIWSFLQEGWSRFTATLSGIWGTISSNASAAWSGISNAVISFAQSLWGRLQEGWSTMVSAASQAWENVKSAASSAWGYLRDGWERLKAGLEGLWKGMVSRAGEIWEGLVSIVRGILNRVIALANSVISALNSIRITVPEWIPGIGGLSWGVSIPLIPSLQGLREPVEIARETLVKLHPGEMVLPRGWGAGGVSVYVSVDVRGSVVGVDDLVDAVSRGIASNLRRMIR